MCFKRLNNYLTVCKSSRFIQGFFSVNKPAETSLPLSEYVIKQNESKGTPIIIRKEIEDKKSSREQAVSMLLFIAEFSYKEEFSLNNTYPLKCTITKKSEFLNTNSIYTS